MQKELAENKESDQSVSIHKQKMIQILNLNFY
jgi:hypothetical protein